MKRLAEAADRAEVARRHRKYHWCRLENSFLDDPLWRTVARRLGMPLYQVQAFVTKLDCLANAAQPRGYVGDFNAEAVGDGLGMPPEDAARLYAELEKPEIGWICQDHVVSFYSRNPDHIDEGAAGRMKRMRDRRKGMKLIAEMWARGDLQDEQHRLKLELEVLNDVPLSTALQRYDALRRNAVTVTTDQTKNFEESGKTGDNNGGAARGEADGNRGVTENAAVPVDDPRVAAEYWLKTSGVRIVTERMEWTRTRAELAIERWRRDLSTGDPAVMQVIIEGAEGSNYMGAPFHNLIVDQCRRQVRNASGQHNLPIPPTPVRKAAG